MKSLLFAIFFLTSTFLFGFNFRPSNWHEIIEAEAKAKGGDTIRIAPNTYIQPHKLVFDGVYEKPLVVIAHGASFKGGTFPYTLDLFGNNIKWFGGNFSGGAQATVAIRGNDVYLSDADISGSRTGVWLIGRRNTIEGCAIHDVSTTGIDGNNGKLDLEKRSIVRGFTYENRNNWKILGNEFYNIHPRNPGEHGGGIKMVPGAFGVTIAGNIFHHIGGNALWFDKYQGELIIYGNQFYDNAFKNIFLEISDENPRKKPKFGAIIAGNIVRNGERHGIFISASSNCDVFGNIVSSWLPGVIHGMPRKFNVDREGELADTTKEAKLIGNRFHHNVIKNTYHSAHIAVYDGEGASDNQVYRNYYTIGHKAERKDEWIMQAQLSINSGSYLGGVDKAGLDEFDAEGIEGPWIETLPFSFAESGIQALLDKYPELDEYTIMVW